MATTSFDKKIVVKSKKAVKVFESALVKPEIKVTNNIDVVSELKRSCSRLKRKYSR